jgi:hypothetical protein
MDTGDLEVVLPNPASCAVACKHIHLGRLIRVKPTGNVVVEE